MKTMKIITPEGTDLAEVPEDEVHSFLATHGLAAVRSGWGPVVAFAAEAKDVVDQALSGGILRLRYHGLTKLGPEIVRALEDNELVALVASRNVMREFFSTEGFCTLMRRLTSQLNGVELAVPPGAYTDHKHVAVWRQAASAPT